MQSKKYDMNIVSLTAMGIGSVVGAGIFALLGQVILLAGNWTYAAFILAGTAAMFSGYTYAKLAGRYPDYGGMTDYFHFAFKNDVITGTLSIIYMLASLVSIAMMAKSFGIYVASLFPHFPNHDLLMNAVAGALVISLAILNMMRASDVGNSEILMVAIKMGILLSLIFAALWHLELAVEQELIQTTPMKFLGSVGVTFFAYAGYGIVTNAAAEVKNPKRTVGWAIFLTLGFVMLMYIGLAYVVLNFIPAHDLRQNADTAVAIAADRLLGKYGFAIMYFAALLAFVSGISATYFSIFRISRSLSNFKILPKFYHEKFWEHGTKGNVLSTALLAIATIYFDFSSIVNFSSGAYLVSYLGVFSAAWILRKEIGASGFIIAAGIALMLFIFITFMVSIFSPEMG